MTLIRTLLVAALVAALAPAQQNVGINVFRGPVTTSGVLCGFDCNSRSNVGRSSVQPFDSIGVRLLGDAGLPAAVIFGLSPSAAVCPGIVLPGIGNSLLIDPTTLIAGPVSASLTGANRSCNATANQPVLNGFIVPFAASGITITVQGLVHDGGRAAFTRPIEITVQ